MTNELIKAKAQDVSSMSEDELFKFGASVDSSHLDAKSKMYLYDCIDERVLELRVQFEAQGANVVCSEIKHGELS